MLRFFAFIWKLAFRAAALLCLVIAIVGLFTSAEDLTFRIVVVIVYVLFGNILWWLSDIFRKG